MFRKIREFIESVTAEFKRVQWPDRDSTLKSTSVVLVLSVVIAIFLGVADLGLSEVMQSLISS